MEGGGGAGAGFLGFVMFFIIGYLLWFNFIGPDDPDSRNPFICPPPPLGNGRTYHVSDAKNSTYEALCGTYANEMGIEKPPPRATSTLEGRTTLASPRIKIEKFTAGPKSTDPAREYLVISADSRNPAALNVTGWRVGSLVSGRIYSIPQASYLPIPGRVNAKEDVWLGPGDHMVVSTGRSPVGVSFRTNTCTGYIGQHQLYVPALPRECPLMREELPATPETIRAYGDSCLDYVRTIGKCEAHDGNLPYPKYSGECASFISSRANYTGCVAAHKASPDFYGREWRVFLDRNEEIWRSTREIIRLYDRAGQTVDTMTY